MPVGKCNSEAIRRTLTAISAVRAVPSSPGAMVDDRPCLCTAAMYVYQVAAEGSSSGQLRALARNFVRLGKFYILQTAYRLNIDLRLVEMIMIKNDSFEQGIRKAGMIAFLEGLVKEQA
jgi:hypothetical protein